ncbi:EAL domain-containing protein (putative c-di-GMP-specific phosphodiesterase class I) [Kineococcus xinjiangensis]|uniref:EAL domain-containing protein (Putative c-di-GMP-specific phosphodiesterase class I) n=1 Tax=Kineococcus xinjiangensis TaxID=512762 RepID=A0A2S6IJ69_9ACTN|nr:EAL domain-containing protein [Kineococcus xinjiangensis]PPK94267.1 EAL domain-containing protein (putative c-di-GMP-specific phosphodiesterase class I) [Kineococcus xinjiangensis]
MELPQGAPHEFVGVQRMLDLARTHLGMEVAWLSQFGDGQQVIHAASGDTAAMNVVLGEGTPLHGSFCVRVISGALPPVVPDARRDLVARDLDVTRDLGIGSYVGAPVRDADGAVTGMLCCLSRTASPELDVHASRYAALVADLISDHLASAAVLEQRDRQRTRMVVQGVLGRGAIRMLFQPVVALDTGHVVGVEALARFDVPSFPTPAHAFAAATHVGLGTELELLAVRRALAGLEQLPRGVRLSVNLSAEALLDPATPDLLLRAGHRARRDGRSLCVEVTEHTQVMDYPALIEVTGRLREAGLALAVDDAGAGFASLRHILRLRPDVIKADLDLVRGVDSDPVRQALIRSLVGFAAEIGADLIAEGIETQAEREALLDLGVPLGQGYLLGRPAPLPVLEDEPVGT